MQKILEQACTAFLIKTHDWRQTPHPPPPVPTAPLLWIFLRTSCWLISQTSGSPLNTWEFCWLAALPLFHPWMPRLPFRSCFHYATRKVFSLQPSSSPPLPLIPFDILEPVFDGTWLFSFTLITLYTQGCLLMYISSLSAAAHAGKHRLRHICVCSILKENMAGWRNPTSCLCSSQSPLSCIFLSGTFRMNQVAPKWHSLTPQSRLPSN